MRVTLSLGNDVATPCVLTVIGSYFFGLLSEYVPGKQSTVRSKSVEQNCTATSDGCFVGVEGSHCSLTYVWYGVSVWGHTVRHAWGGAYAMECAADLVV